MKCYHWTTQKSYQSMQTPGIDGYLTCHDDISGIIPNKRHVHLSEGFKTLPQKAHEGIFEGLLTPEPKQWMDNPRFPNLWYYLFNDIIRDKKIGILSFEVEKSDDAYIIDRSYIEHELYRESMGFGKSTSRSKNLAHKKSWETMVRPYDYKVGFDVPQFIFFSPVEFQRLTVEKTYNSEDYWKKVLENSNFKD